MSINKKDYKTSTHHILCKSRGGNNNTSNLIELRHNYHQAIHTLFENKMIAEQLIRTIDINKSALREDVREWLLETLTSKDIDDPYTRYKNEVII